MAEQYRGLNFGAKTEQELLALFRDQVRISDDWMTPWIRKAITYLTLYYNRHILNRIDPYWIAPKLGKEFSTIDTYVAATLRTMFGSKPYMPLAPRRPDLGWKRNVEVMQDAMDIYAERYNHFGEYDLAVTHCHTLGTGFLWSGWKIKPTSKKRKEGVYAAGRKIGERTVSDPHYDEGLILKAVAPWMVRFDPRANLRAVRWFMEFIPISRSALKLHMDAGLYEKKYDDLPKTADYGKNGLLGNYFLERLQTSASHIDLDMCMLIKWYLPWEKKYVVVLDGEAILRVESYADNPEDYYLPYATFINTQSQIPDSLLGLTDMAIITQLSSLIESSVAYRINSLRQQFEQVWLYNKDAFPDPNILKTAGGSRIGIDGAKLRAEGYRWDQLMYPVPITPISNDAWNITPELEKYYEGALGTDPTVKGAATEEARTKFEIETRVDRHDQRFAAKIKRMEVGMELAAMHAYDCMGRNMTPKLKQELVGDRARYWAWDRPAEVPGGTMWMYKGSGLMAGLKAQQQERLDLHGQMKDSPFINRGALERTIFNKSEAFMADEVEEIFTLPEQPPGQSLPGGAPGAGAVPAIPGIAA